MLTKKKNPAIWKRKRNASSFPDLPWISGTTHIRQFRERTTHSISAGATSKAMRPTTNKTARFKSKTTCSIGALNTSVYKAEHTKNIKSWKYERNNCFYFIFQFFSFSITYWITFISSKLSTTRKLMILKNSKQLLIERDKLNPNKLFDEWKELIHVTITKI